MSSRFDDFLAAIDKELRNAKRNYEHAKISAQEVAASAAASPSQAGDRYHSQGSADLAKQKYNAVLALKAEVKQKGDNILVERNGEALFFVDNPVMIRGFKLVSTKSPLGQKLLNEE